MSSIDSRQQNGQQTTACQASDATQDDRGANSRDHQQFSMVSGHSYFIYGYFVCSVNFFAWKRQSEQIRRKSTAEIELCFYGHDTRLRNHGIWDWDEKYTNEAMLNNSMLVSLFLI